MAGYGDAYATIAMGITDNSTVIGKLANSYFDISAQAQGVAASFGSSKWTQVNLDLANAYLDAYEDDPSHSTPNYQSAIDIHHTVYTNNQLNKDAWVLENIIAASTNKAQTYSNFLNADSSDILTEIGGYLSSQKMSSAGLVLTQQIFNANFSTTALVEGTADSQHLLNLATAYAIALSEEVGEGIDFLGYKLDPNYSLLNAYQNLIYYGQRLSAGDRPIVQFIIDAEAQFSLAQAYHCPLVLDLDTSGITLTSATLAPVYWDIDNDGFREASGWVGPQDGLLAIDLNSNGVIDNHAELFGTSTQNGFAILAAYDNNSSGTITAADTDFAKLLVWIDANSDAYTQDGELHSMTDLGITAISLSTTATAYSLAGNPVTAQSAFTQNGVSKQIISAEFLYNNVNTTFDGNYTLDPRTLFLPDLRGYGRLADLHVVMSRNEALLDKVVLLATATVADVLNPNFDIYAKICELLYTWAGVQDLPTDIRTAIMWDDREVEFMEELLDRDFLPERLVPMGGKTIDHAFTDLYNSYFARILAQTDFGKLLTGNIYDPITDTFSAFTGLDTNILAELQDIAAISDNPQYIWQQIVRLIEGSVGIDTLSIDDADALDAAIAATYPGYNLIDVLNSIQYPEPTDFYGTSSTDTLTGSEGDDRIFGRDGNDTINGGRNFDQIDGGRGDDTLIGGTGDDALFGGEGSDTYIYVLGDGPDNIDEASDSTGTLDAIVLNGGINQGDVVMSRVDGNNLQIDINGGGRIYVFDQFDAGRSVERLIFSDGSSLNLTTLGGTVTGTSGNDTLAGADTGYFPHDVLLGLNGNDTLAGGLGNDILEGGSGNDVYQITAGLDIVRDSSGNDTLVFDSGYNKNNITYKVVNGIDLQILFNNVPAILIEKQFTISGAVETLQFSDNSTISLSGLSLSQEGTAAGDKLYGLEFGSSTNDTLYGLGGNDTLSGGSGNDTLIGGSGNDTLNGGAGNDMFLLGTGVDYVRDSSGTDTIVFSPGYDVDDIGLKRTETELEINFNGTIAARVGDFFLSGPYSIETIKFDDNSTFDLTAYHNVSGTSGNDTLAGLDNPLLQDDYLYGLAGNDSLSGGDGKDVLSGGNGADHLTGGSGDDRLEGGSDNDTFFYSAGIDTIVDTSGTDTIVFASGFDQVDMSLVRTGSYDLSLRFDGVEALLVKNQFANTSAVETLKFSDNSTLDLTTHSYETNGTSGNDTLYGIDIGGGGDVLNGNDGYDFLYGQGGDDILSGGNGNDSLNGGAGNDTYIVTSGVDSIQDSNGNDTIRFSAVYDLADLSLVRSGQYGLDIRFGGFVTLHLANQFSQNGGIETLEFDDNSSVDLTNMQYNQMGTSGNDIIYGISYGGVAADIIDGADGNDIIYGYDGNDTLAGGSGSDTLNGGLGNDVYNYSSGVDIIADQGGSDTISLGAGFVQSNMSLEKINTSDLKISFGGIHALTIFGQLSQSGGIETLQFSDTTTYSLANFRNIINGTSATQTLNGSNSATVVDAIYAGGGTDTINANAGDDYLYGEDGNDELNAGDGNDVLEGGSGNDTLYGGNGNDTYIFGSGNDTINEVTGAGGTDVIQFGSGIAFEDLDIYRVYDAGSVPDNLHIADTNGNGLVIARQFSTIGTARPVEKLAFADGSEILLSSINITMFGTSGADSLAGVPSEAGLNDTLIGYGGNDGINGGSGNDWMDGGAGNDNLAGGAGDDTYVFAPGFATSGGQDTVTEAAASGTDMIVFKDGILPENLRSWVASDGYMYIQFANAASDALRITGSNALTASDISTRIERIVFEGIETWDLTQGLIQIDTDSGHSMYGSAQNDFIDGRGGNDTIYGHAGNDTLIGGAGQEVINGGTGDDTFIFSHGFGGASADVVNENASEGADRVIIHDVLPNDIRAWIDTSGDLYVQNFYNTSDTFILNASSSNGSDIGSRFEKIVFDDGTEWDLTAGVIEKGLDTGQSMIGTAYNDIIDGMAGNDTINGYAGDDTLIGGAGTDTMIGGTGNDVYIFASGFGASPNPDLITENTSEGMDVIRLTGVDATDVRSWSDGSYYYLNFVNASTDLVRVTVTNGTTGVNIGSRIEHVMFDNGTNWNLTLGLFLNDTDTAHTIYGSAQGDTIYGNGGNDIIYGVNGDDTLYGGLGNDTLTGGEGSDTLNGDAGADTIYGGNGSDVLYGGADADYLSGEAGADTYIFKVDTAFGSVDNINAFNIGQGDALDLRDLLIGYDPMQNSINDFITLTGSTHTTISVDRDGTGTDYTAQSVALLLSTTGLNVSTMVTNHNLLVTDT